MSLLIGQKKVERNCPTTVKHKPLQAQKGEALDTKIMGKKFQKFTFVLLVTVRASMIYWWW